MSMGQVPIPSLEERKNAERNGRQQPLSSHSSMLNKELEAEYDLEHAKTQDQKPEISEGRPVFKSFLQEVCFVATICSIQLIVQAGLAQSIVPAHIIGAHFGSTPPELSWYAAAYSLTIGTFIMPAGRLGDMYGHKRMFMFGALWFGLWALIAGFSTYSGQILFDCCRAFQGAGAALMFPNATALLGRAYPPGRRMEMVLSIYGACAPNGFLLGALFSGIFAQLLWWPWAYWATAIAAGGLMLVSYFSIPDMPDDMDKLTLLRTTSDGNALRKTAEQVDLYGALTGVIGLILINLSLNQGPVVGWTHPYTYILLIIGFLFMGVFFYIELKVATNPLVPIRKLKFTSLFALACIGVGWSSFGVWLYYIWQIMLVLRHQSPLQSTAQIVPIGFSGGLAAITTGWLISRVKPGYIMFAAMTAFVVGNLLVAIVPVDQTYWSLTFVTFIITPWGMDLSFPSATIILSNAAPKSEQGAAASLVTTVQNYAIAIGLGFAGTVESQVNRGGTDILRGYRGASYLGIGLASIGMVVAFAFIVLQTNREERPDLEPDEEKPDNQA